MSQETFTNFLSQYKNSKTNKIENFTATQFAEVWSHYDVDGNGYIEGTELDAFLREFISSVIGDEFQPNMLGRVFCFYFCCYRTIDDKTLSEIKKDFLATFDENSDNKIDISELAQFLPTDENFLLLFRRNNPLESSVEFMKIWKKFDRDRSGFIEADELKNFLIQLLKEARPEDIISEEKIIEYTSTMLILFDQNKDGKLQLSEMARLLPVKENYLCRPIFRNASKITAKDIENVFKLYDRDRNGTIEDEELQGFLKDLMALAQEDYDEEDLDFFRTIILKEWDVNHDGKISLDELKMMLLQQSKLTQLCQ